MHRAFDGIIRDDGIQAEKNYPYTASYSGGCQQRGGTFKIHDYL